MEIEDQVKKSNKYLHKGQTLQIDHVLWDSKIIYELP